MISILNVVDSLLFPLLDPLPALCCRLFFFLLLASISSFRYSERLCLKYITLGFHCSASTLFSCI